MERERPPELIENPEPVDGEADSVEPLSEEELLIRIAAQLDLDPLSLSAEVAASVAESYQGFQQVERALTADELARLRQRLRPDREPVTEEPSTSPVADGKKPL